MNFFLPSIKTEDDASYRIEVLEKINTKIFSLVYYGRFSYEGCESMTSAELNWFYTKLLETKDAENKAREDAIKSIKRSKRTAKSLPSRRRRSGRVSRR